MGKVDLANRLENARARVEAEAPTEDRGLAKFERLTRKDARVRADQDAALAALAKSLMRRRLVKAERITENTLIRVAIDLLLTHAEELRGSTEEELRESVTSAVSEFRTSDAPQSRRHGLPDSRASELPQSAASGMPHSRASGRADVRRIDRGDRRAAATGDGRGVQMPSDPVASSFAARQAGATRV